MTTGFPFGPACDTAAAAPMATPATHSPLFVTTRWSLILAAQGDEASALEELCRGYWYPLYAYVRRAGHAPHDAQDLTQEFFGRLLQRGWLLAAAPERGRFRSFLLVAMKRLLAKEWHRSQAQKRGGGLLVPLDLAEAERRYAGEPIAAADEMYERRWAMTLLEQTLDHLRTEYAQAGKPQEYALLREWLTAARGEIPYAELAQRLETTEGAARVAVHRLRKRFREAFRAAVAETVSEPAEIESELRYLAGVLSRV